VGQGEPGTVDPDHRAGGIHHPLQPGQQVTSLGQHPQLTHGPRDHPPINRHTLSFTGVDPASFAARGCSHPRDGGQRQPSAVRTRSSQHRSTGPCSDSGRWLRSDRRPMLPFADVPTGAVAVAWEARAARVAATPRRVPDGKVVRLRGVTALQDAADASWTRMTLPAPPDASTGPRSPARCVAASGSTAPGPSPAVRWSACLPAGISRCGSEPCGGCRMRPPLAPTAGRPDRRTGIPGVTAGRPARSPASTWTQAAGGRLSYRRAAQQHHVHTGWTMRQSAAPLGSHSRRRP
jgi:hypothetical protein